MPHPGTSGRGRVSETECSKLSGKWLITGSHNPASKERRMMEEIAELRNTIDSILAGWQKDTIKVAESKQEHKLYVSETVIRSQILSLIKPSPARRDKE